MAKRSALVLIEIDRPPYDCVASQTGIVQRWHGKRGPMLQAKSADARLVSKRKRSLRARVAAAFTALILSAGLVLIGTPADAAALGSSCSTDIFGHPCKTVAVKPSIGHVLHWSVISIYGFNCHFIIEDTANHNVVGNGFFTSSDNGDIGGLYSTYVMTVYSIACEGGISGYGQAVPPA